jgi:SSS family solute:Na+ symporter
VLQFFLIVLGFLPLVYLGLKSTGGWNNLVSQLNVVAANHNPPFPPGTWTSSWSHMASSQDNPMGADWFTMIFGLGFVLSFGYWCTDFLVVQRAMAADSMSSARRTPLIAAFPKMLFPFLVILPGMIAIALQQKSGGTFLPLTVDKSGPDYNMATPMMLAKFFPHGLLGLGLTALMASFMSGMAGNVTAFNTVFTYDIYQSYLVKNRSDTHYLWVGRVTTVAGIAISIAAAYVCRSVNNIMDILQLVFGIVNAPLFATFLLGMFWKRATGHGAFWGLLAGTLAAALHHGLTGAVGDPPGWIHGGWIMKAHVYQADMGQAYWQAIYAFMACISVTIVISLATPRTKSDADLKGLVYSLTPRLTEHDGMPWYKQPATLCVIVLAMTIALNIIFR